MSYLFDIKYKFDPESGKVCVEIPSLNYLSDYGDTFEEAEGNILNAASLYLKEFQPNQIINEIEVSGTKILVEV